MIKNQTDIEIIYPTSDGEAVAVDGFPGISKLLNPKGEPLAETYAHLYAILVTLEILQQYLQGQQATVLADQFLYYAQGFPRLRVAPDVMVIFNVAHFIISGG